MANNIFIGANFVMALQTETWANVGLATINTIDVYTAVEGNPLSWRPNKTLNTLQGPGIVENNVYQLNSKITRDLSSYFGVPESGGDDPAVSSSIFNT